MSQSSKVSYHCGRVERRRRRRRRRRWRASHKKMNGTDAAAAARVEPVLAANANDAPAQKGTAPRFSFDRQFTEDLFPFLWLN